MAHWTTIRKGFTTPTYHVTTYYFAPRVAFLRKRISVYKDCAVARHYKRTVRARFHAGPPPPVQSPTPEPNVSYTPVTPVVVVDSLQKYFRTILRQIPAGPALLTVISPAPRMIGSSKIPCRQVRIESAVILAHRLVTSAPPQMQTCFQFSGGVFLSPKVPTVLSNVGFILVTQKYYQAIVLQFGLANPS
jgi:hypothetical protein